MHEGNFTTQIVEAIMSAIDKFPDQKPTRIKVQVGEMLHLNPESVQTHFEALTRGGALANAKLDLEQTPVKVRCRQCNAEWHPEDHHFLYCDFCAGTDVEILSGNSVTVDSILLETLNEK